MVEKISIITVCFNSAKTIEDTLKSVVSQTYTNIEYIIIDGVSTDETLSLIEKYRDQLSVVISEKDKGMYDAINKGIQVATGDVIGVLNSDDFYVDEFVVEKIMKQFNTSKADSLYADLYYVDTTDTNKITRYWKSGLYKKKKFLYGWMPPHPTFFVKKVCYEKYGLFNLNLRTAADYELMLRFLYKHNITATYLRETIVKMRIGGMSNVSIKNRIRANKEDKKAWEINGLKSTRFTFIAKPLRKILQYIIK